MKKLFLVGMLLVASTALASHGGRKYGASGCGLGSMVFDDHNSVVSQVLSATTNGSSYSQLFGITSGTSNCTDDGTVASNNQMPMFVEANRVALAKDAARGEGETIASLSSVMGCDSSAQLGTVLQQNYEHVFSGDSAAVIQNIRNVVKGNAELAKSCKDVG